MLSPALGAAALMLLAGPALAQQAAPQGAFPMRIPAPGGEVILPTPSAKRAYDEIKYAASRRAGDMLYISGVIAGGGRPDKPIGPAAFKDSLRRSFRELERNLQAAGAGFEDVVMINSYHLWVAPNFAGTQQDHFRAVSEVKDEFMKGPHPAWTAVGSSGLLAPDGLVEIQMIARLPAGAGRP